MSSSQFAQVERGAGEGRAADGDEAADLGLLRGVPAAGAGRDRPGRRRDDEHEYGDDQAVGQQGADDGAEVAGAADGAEVRADIGPDQQGRIMAFRCALGSPHRRVQTESWLVLAVGSGYAATDSALVMSATAGRESANFDCSGRVMLTRPASMAQLEIELWLSSHGTARVGWAGLLGGTDVTAWRRALLPLDSAIETCWARDRARIPACYSAGSEVVGHGVHVLRDVIPDDVGPGAKTLKGPPFAARLPHSARNDTEHESCATAMTWSPLTWRLSLRRPA